MLKVEEVKRSFSDRFLTRTTLLCSQRSRVTRPHDYTTAAAVITIAATACGSSGM